MRQNLIPDIIISVRFFTTSEGGRLRDVQGEYYRCPLLVDGEAFECRLLLYGRHLELGTTYEVPVKFLSREYALPMLYVGKEVLLWEFKVVANAHVTNILAVNHEL